MQIKGELLVNLEEAAHSNLKPVQRQRSLDYKHNNRAAFLFLSSTLRAESLCYSTVTLCMAKRCLVIYAWLRTFKFHSNKLKMIAYITKLLYV